MSDQEQQTVISSENLPTLSNNENLEKVEDDQSKSSEQTSTRRSKMPQDIRYSNEQNNDQEKYDNYQISDTNACNIRFLIDNRQKKSLFDRKEDDNSNLQSIGKTFRVNIFPGYQQPPKHSYKIFGAEANVRQCLIEIMNRIFKRSTRSTKTENTKPEPAPAVVEESKAENGKSPPHPTSIFVTTINPDSSITEEKKAITPSTPTTNGETTEQEQLKFVPLERKPQYTFIMLITTQGQEALKKNWSSFAGSLQQRLNVVVTNPVKLPKFGDKKVQNELPITGESIDNLTNACLQIAAFINDVLGVPVQPYKYDDEETSTTTNDNNKNSRSSSSQVQGRTFFNRNRNGTFEQSILIRNDCVARIIGTRGSNLKRIQTKCHLRDMIVGRQANDKGYVECTLTAYQTRNLNFAIDTIRSFLRNEDESAVLVTESTQDSPNVQELVPPSNTTSAPLELPQTGIHFMKNNLNQYPIPSYNFQNTPSFDFTHQATSASRKTHKRRGELNDINKTPTESQNQSYENVSTPTYSPKHKSKRACPETKEIDCTTDDGFWIQKQYYYALDDSSKQVFDSLIEKLDKIRIATEENAARKQQRLVGRNRPNKSRVYNSSIAYLKEDNNRNEKDDIIKPTPNENPTKTDQSTDEKENQQETATQN